MLRVQPEGDVGIAPFVSITFNQPMVPLATIGQLDDVDIPVTITPSLPGRWQWIGTRTLRFEHDPEIFDRLPMATSYVVEVPAPTTSQSGGELAEAVRVEFETPAPNMAWLTPQHDSLDLQPVFLVAFDQRIEPAAALEAITFSAGGNQHQIRLASAAEIEGDEYISSLLGYALDDTWVAFRPAAPLEPDSSIRIEVGPHVPSAEGPNTSANSSVVEARTYAPLRLEDTSCSYRGCRPGRALDVWFNNTLDAETLNAADVSITPELPGATVSVHGRTITIAGPTAGGTTYEVVIPEALGDVFGQTLESPRPSSSASTKPSRTSASWEDGLPPLIRSVRNRRFLSWCANGSSSVCASMQWSRVTTGRSWILRLAGDGAGTEVPWMCRGLWQSTRSSTPASPMTPSPRFP